MNRLRQMVVEKTGYIQDELYYEALQVAKADVKAHPIDFSKKSKPEKQKYIAYTMAVYIALLKR